MNLRTPSGGDLESPAFGRAWLSSRTSLQPAAPLKTFRPAGIQTFLTPRPHGPAVPAAPAGPEPEPSLRRDLGPTEAITIILGSVIGSGIFFVPGDVAREVGSAKLVLLVWVAAGLVNLAGAIAYAELAGMFPRSGGQYVFIRETYGRLLGFLQGWSIFLATKTGTLAAVAVAFAMALDALVDLPEYGVKWAAMLLVTGLTWVNFLGVRLGGLVQNVSTGLKVAALAGLIAAGLLLEGDATAFEAAALTTPTGLALLSAAGVAFVAVHFAFDGWYNASQVAEEIREPQRNVPKATVVGTVVVLALYLLAQVAYLKVLGPERLAASDFPGADLAEAVLGAPGRTVLAIAVLVSTFGTINAMVLTGPRIYFAMARDGVFFRALARVHPRHATPSTSILVAWCWSLVLIATGTFEQLVTFSIFVTWVFLSLAALAVFLLRRRLPDHPRPYRAWGYPWVPGVFLVFALAFVVNTLVRRPVEAGAGLLLLAAGLPIYWYWNRREAATGSSRTVK